MTPPVEDRLPTRELPCALVRLWDAQEVSRPPQIQPTLYDRDGATREVDPGWLAVFPYAGSPEVFDRGLWVARCVTSALKDEGVEARAVVLPGRVVVDRDRLRRIIEPLESDLEGGPPDVEPDAIAITARAAAALEHRRQVERTIEYAGASGHVLPLQVLGEACPWPPWRNSEIIGHTLKMLPRPETGDLRALLFDKPTTRLQGSLGCGKTRLVAESIADVHALAVWTHADLPLPGQLRLAFQSGGIPADVNSAEAIAEVLAADHEWYEWQSGGDEVPLPGPDGFERLFRQITARLGRPVLWVYDDVHRLSEESSTLLAGLSQSEELGRSLRMIWIGRPGAIWPAGAEDSPLLSMPDWTEAVFQTLVEQTIQELDLPRHLVQPIAAATTGCPFAVEEAIFGLLHEQEIRQQYGNFFFSGGASAEAVPSARLIRHVSAECARLGDEWPLAVLASAGRAVPPDEVRTAASMIGATSSKDWAEPCISSGLLVQTDSPWGPAVTWSSPLFGSAIAATLSPDDRRRLAVQVGSLLDARSVRSGAKQDAWQLLAGSDAAVDSLLERLRSESSEAAPGEDLIETLSNELAAHRRRHGDAEREFALTCHLLRRASAKHRLGEFGTEIQRAEVLARGAPERTLSLAPILAEHYQHRGELHHALEAAHEALRVAPREDLQRRILMMIQIGRLLARMNRHESAHDLFAGLLRLLPAGGDTPLRATCSFYLGNLQLHAGRLDQALLLHQQALAIRRQRADPRATGESFCAIGTALQAQGKFPAALRSFEGALAILEPLERPSDIAFALAGIGRIKTRLGDFTGAGAALDRALKLRRSAGERIGQALAELLVAENLLEMARAGEAISLVREAHFRLRLARLDRYVADALQLLGRALLSLNQPAEAATQFEAAERVHRRTGDIQSARLDLSWRLKAAMATSNRAVARPLLDRLVAEMGGAEGQDMEELIDYRIFSAFAWIEREDDAANEAPNWLKRANAELLRRAERLEPRQRHRYLSEIHEHREILDRAAHLI